MLRKVNSQTNVKTDINYVIDIQNIQGHNNNKELGIFYKHLDIFLNIIYIPKIVHFANSR